MRLAIIVCVGVFGICGCKKKGKGYKVSAAVKAEFSKLQALVDSVKLDQSERSAARVFSFSPKDLLAFTLQKGSYETECLFISSGAAFRYITEIKQEEGKLLENFHARGKVDRRSGLYRSYRTASITDVAQNSSLSITRNANLLYEYKGPGEALFRKCEGLKCSSFSKIKPSFMGIVTSSMCDFAAIKGALIKGQVCADQTFSLSSGTDVMQYSRLFDVTGSGSSAKFLMYVTQGEKPGEGYAGAILFDAKGISEQWVVRVMVEGAPHYQYCRRFRFGNTW